MRGGPKRRRDSNEAVQLPSETWRVKGNRERLGRRQEKRLRVSVRVRDCTGLKVIHMVPSRSLG